MRTERATKESPDGRLTPQQFAAKWTASSLKERSAAQEHFIDLCRMLGESTPAEADPNGEWFCFERGAKKTGGGDGWADVWRRGCFAWEYKGKHQNLDVAFAQLQRYAIALENPPLLVVSDMARIEIHSNFTNTVHEKHVIPITEIGTDHNLRLLRQAFADPDKLKPGRTKTAITEEAARRFASLAKILRDRGGEAQRVAHFLNRILFCLFAQDAKLLPANIVVQLLEIGVRRPDEANKMLRTLFATMKKGGIFGTHVIEWFNGNLFDSSDAVPLQADDIAKLLTVASLDWSAIEPSIFGTLFERGLDPEKRAQIGAHYTDPQSIMRIVRPAVIDPLEADWQKTKREIESLFGKTKTGASASSRGSRQKRAQQLLNAFLERLGDFRVLDPACGSGNFLYLALQALKDLEHRATLEAEQLGLEASFTGMHVGVHCARGIEFNSYAAELARVTVWIGEIQWMLRHGAQPSRNPILKPLDTIEHGDAILNRDGTEPEWPAADAIVGNPPFLGDKKMVRELGREYVSSLRKRFQGRVPGGADLVTYWFEKARSQIETGKAKRAGLVATNSIRGGASRKVLEKIRENLTIFDAWSDEPWINEGAAVRVSLVCFRPRENIAHPHLVSLNGFPANDVFSDLTGTTRDGGVDITKARPLAANLGVAFSGITKKGSFDVSGSVARAMLQSPGNPNARPNSDVLFPWKNGSAITDRDPDKWIVNFGERSLAESARYEAPFEHIRREVFRQRSKSNSPGERRWWWLLARRAPDFFSAVQGKARFIVTPEVSKHRVFVWLPAGVIPDKNLVAIARDDDATLGILSSRFHAVWALRLGTSLEDRPRYTSSTTFRTFPFPAGMEPGSARSGPSGGAAIAIEAAARKLNELREAWLNPSALVDVVPELVPALPHRLVPKAGREAELSKRTLTNLYNDRPVWLANAHDELDHAVASAYGWTEYSPALPDDEILNRLLKLNIERTHDLFTSLQRRQRDAADHKQGPNAVTSIRRVVPRKKPSAETLELRLAITCTLINRLADDPNFGRTKMAKLFYLIDATQNLNLETSYQRQAAGPLDPTTLYSAETGLEALATKHDYLRVERSGRKITYRRGANLGKALERARDVLGSSRRAINRLIDRFRKLDTDQSEIVATLYACWNDRILDGKETDDGSIVEEFLTAWHEKKRRFPRQRLLKALGWMRATDLVPTGQAPHTLSRRATTR